MRIETKSVPDLTEAEFKECCRLSLREKGEMAEQARFYRRRPKDYSRVWLVRDDDDRLIAWSMIFKYRKDAANWTFHVYVRRTERKKGIGKMLLGRARKGRKTPLRVFPHTKAATALYEKAQSQGRAAYAYSPRT